MFRATKLLFSFHLDRGGNEVVSSWLPSSNTSVQKLVFFYSHYPTGTSSQFLVLDGASEKRAFLYDCSSANIHAQANFTWCWRMISPFHLPCPLQNAEVIHHFAPFPFPEDRVALPLASIIAISWSRQPNLWWCTASFPSFRIICGQGSRRSAQRLRNTWSVRNTWLIWLWRTLVHSKWLGLPLAGWSQMINFQTNRNCSRTSAFLFAWTLQISQNLSCSCVS